MASSKPTVDHKVVPSSRYAYVKYKCRCQNCKDANAEYKRAKTAQYRGLQASKGRKDISPDTQSFLDGLTHGLPSTYEWYGCRCPDCTEAKAVVSRDQRFVKLIA